MANSINEGDKVKYKREFLRSIGEITGDMPFARGVVQSIKQVGSMRLAVVDWQNPELPEKVNMANLTLASNAESF